jgi:hypothetical protein
MHSILIFDTSTHPVNMRRFRVVRCRGTVELETPYLPQQWLKLTEPYRGAPLFSPPDFLHTVS